MKFRWIVWVSLLLAEAIVALAQDTGCSIGSGTSVDLEIFEDQEINIIFDSVETSNTISVELKKIDDKEDIIGYEFSEETGKLSFYLQKSVEHFPDQTPPRTSLQYELVCSGKEKKGDDIVLNLKIKDINNSPPEFIDSPYEFSMIEVSPIGTTINSDPIKVYDNDFVEGDNVLMYVASDIDGEKPFKILYTTTSFSKEQDVYIVLTEELDYSKQKEYNFALTVTDKGEPPLSSSTTVAVTVIDVDNQDPVFEKFFYYTRIIIIQLNNNIIVKNKEDSDGIPLKNLRNLNLEIQPKRIFAYDQDFGINATVNYVMGANNWTDYFRMNGDGSVFLEKMDETIIRNNLIVLPLEAYQIDNEKRRARATLVVNVTVVNPPQPHFVYQINILKNLLAGDSFYQVNAMQDDITYGLKENQQYISIDETSGSLFLLNNASEIPSFFTSTIEARTSVPSVQNEFQGRFNVTKQDARTTPIFAKSMYIVEISKSSKIKDHLFAIEVADSNAKLHLTGEDAKYFAIEESTKWIILNDDLELEKMKYSVVIEATIKYSDSVIKRDATEILFQVTDSDCHPKIFDKDVYLVDMSAEWTIDSTILNGTSALPGITFSLSGTDNYENYFYVNSDTGSITLIKEINICQRHELLLFGQREIPPFHNATAEVILIPTALKCHANLFEKDCFWLNISSEWQIGENIFNVTTTDTFPDVLFTLEGKDDYFKINNITGLLFLNARMDKCKRHHLIIHAETQGPPPRKGVTE